MKPTDRIIEWFNDVPKDEQPDIAVSVIIALPDFPNKIEAMSDDTSHVFIDWLKNDNGSRLEVVSKTLIAKTLIEFFAFQNKKSTKDWEAMETFHDKSLQNFKEEGANHMIETSENLLKDLPSRAVSWQIIYSNWQNLCENELSDDQIKDWLDEKL